MAATLSSVDRHSMGDSTLHIWKFSSIATSDTYDTALGTAITGYWMNITSGFAAATTQCPLNVSEASGTLTFTSGAGPGATFKATVYTMSNT